MMDALCELRAKGEGTTPQAETLARNIEARLNELKQTVGQAINRVEKSGIQQPSPTVSGRLEQGKNVEKLFQFGDALFNKIKCLKFAIDKIISICSKKMARTTWN